MGDFPRDVYVKLKVNTPDRSGGEEVDRGGVLEEEAWDSENNFIGVEIVPEDSEVKFNWKKLWN